MPDFDLEEYKKKDRLDAYLDFINPDHELKKLPKDMMQRYELMLQARAWRIGFFSRGQVVKMLMEKEVSGKKLSHSAAYQLLKDADVVLYHYDEVSKKAERAVMYEHLHKAMAMVQMDKETPGTERAKATTQIVKQMAELLGLNDFAEHIDPKSLMPPATIVFLGPNQINGHATEKQ